MRFNSGLAQLYRNKGYLFVARDVYTGVYDIFIQTNDGPFYKIGTEYTKSEAVKEAKKQSMIRKLGFNPKIDVVAESILKGFYKSTSKGYSILREGNNPKEDAFNDPGRFVLARRIRGYDPRNHFIL